MKFDDHPHIPDWFRNTVIKMIENHVLIYGYVPQATDISILLFEHFINAENVSDATLIHFKAAAERELNRRRIKNLELKYYQP